MATDWKAALAAAAAAQAAGTDTATNAPDSTVSGADSPRLSANGTQPKLNKGKLRVFFERKGRGGKSATIITGFDDLTDDELKAVASKLKQTLGTGGSARGGEILIQGDRQADVKKYFGLKP